MTTRPDAPIVSATADLLERQPFVEEIVDLVLASPREWTPRIGIYGSWGSGKTSILNMIAERVSQANHVVARFNPWGFADSKDMFGALADAILGALEQRGDEIKKSGRRAEKAARTIEKGAKAVGQVARSAADLGVPGAGATRGVAAAAGFVSGALERVFRKKKVEQLFDALAHFPSDVRCLVLVDDLDRAEPALLPPLLFALHEVLVEMPLTFVIALDPIVVGAALKAHHPGFGDGLAFLEKMIQFPRWLPEVADEDRRRLAKADIEQYLPDIDHDALRQEFDRFPRNPRELRTLLRGMWGVAAQAKRYRPAEISWNLILRIAVARQLHRQAFDLLIEDQDRLGQIIGALWYKKRQGGDSVESASPVLEAALRERGLEPASGRALIELLAMSELTWTAGSVVRHARLVDRPPALTRREFEELICLPTEVDNADVNDDSVRNALVRHARAVRQSIGQVVDEALSHVLAMHDEYMAHSADGAFEQDMLDRAKAARWTVGVVGAVTGVSDTAPSVNQFDRILSAFSRWAHFDTLVAYRELHVDERALLLRFCRNAEDPGAYLEILAPWNARNQAGQLRQELAGVLEAAIEVTLDRILERANGVSGMLREHRSAERWCLLRRSAWTRARIERFSSLDTDAASDNALDLLRILANIDGRAVPSRSGFMPAELNAMVSDVSIVRALWSVFVSRPINVRFFTDVEITKTALEERGGTNLPEPSWWQRIREQRYGAQGMPKVESVNDCEPEPLMPVEEQAPGVDTRSARFDQAPVE